MSGCLNGPTGCMTDRHLMINSGGKRFIFFPSLFSQINAGKLRVLLIYSRDSFGGGTGGRRVVCVE